MSKTAPAASGVDALLEFLLHQFTYVAPTRGHSTSNRRVTSKERSMPNSSPNMRRTIKALTEGQHVRNAHAAMLLLLAERQGPHMLVATVDLVAQQKYGAKTLDERLALRPALYGLLGFAKGGNRPFFIARYLRSARSFMDFDKRLTELAKVFAEDSEVISLGARTHPYWVRRGDPSWLVD